MARGGNGWTPLHWASSGGSYLNIETLLAAGANVMARGGDDWTPLHWAASSGTSDNIEVLLAAGADAKAKHLGIWLKKMKKLKAPKATGL
jgi:ankyrin repeat protein